MKQITVLALALALFLASCTTMETATKTSVKAKYGTTKHFNVRGNGIVYRPVVADLEVKPEKVSATITERDVSVKDAKSTALVTVLEKSNADVLIEPMYVIEKNNKEVKVTVRGYPAVYKNFQSIQQSDIPLLNIGSTQLPTTSQGGSTKTTTTTTTTPVKKGLFGLGIFGL